jgi:hypothetical protein
MGSDTAFRFSTDQIPAQDRLAVYREVVGRQFLSLDIEPADASGFRAEFEVHDLPSTTSRSRSASTTCRTSTAASAGDSATRRRRSAPRRAAERHEGPRGNHADRSGIRGGLERDDAREAAPPSPEGAAGL